MAGQTLKVGVVNQPGVAAPVVHTPYRPTATGANAINALDDDRTCHCALCVCIALLRVDVLLLKSIDNGGLPMTAQARANLMANLNRDEPVRWNIYWF